MYSVACRYVGKEQKHPNLSAAGVMSSFIRGPGKVWPLTSICLPHAGQEDGPLKVSQIAVGCQLRDSFAMWPRLSHVISLSLSFPMTTWGYDVPPFQSHCQGKMRSHCKAFSVLPGGWSRVHKTLSSPLPLQCPPAGLCYIPSPGPVSRLPYPPLAPLCATALWTFLALRLLVLPCTS